MGRKQLLKKIKGTQHEIILQVGFFSGQPGEVETEFPLKFFNALENFF